MKRNTQEIPARTELTNYRDSLNEVQGLAEKLSRLSKARTDLAAELVTVEAEQTRLADQLVGAPSPRNLGETSATEDELHKLSKWQNSIQVQLVAIDRQAIAAAETLQKRLPDTMEALGRFCAARDLRILQQESARLLTGIEPDAESEAHALALAKCSSVYKASKVALPGISWAWSQPLHDSGLVKVTPENRAGTIAQLLKMGTELIAKATPLLAGPIEFDVPPFNLPPAPPPTSVPAEWNEPLNRRLQPAPASVSEADDPLVGPFDLEGVDIQAEVRKLIAEDPSLTIVTATPLLRKRFPHLFKRLSELQGPLLAPPPETTTVPQELLIGSTFNL